MADAVPTPMPIPGFVAVASEDRTDVVPTGELDRFAAAYEAICGRGSRRRSYGVRPFAQVIEFPRGEAPAPVGADGGSWSVAAGVAHGAQAAVVPDAAHLDGQFALLTYDERSQTLSVATDPFGMFPLFRASSNGRHYFSTSALALAKHLAASADVLGLLIFLRTGYHFGTRTHWLGVERLDPGSRMVFAPDGVRLERYWLPEADEEITRLDLDATVRACTRACVDTLAHVYSNREAAWADLTGGYDTRLLTVMLDRAGVRFQTNTVGVEWLEDVQIAREVADAAGFDWRRFPLPREASEAFTPLFARALAAGHGHLDALDLMRVLATHEAKRADGSRLLTGGGGEHFQYYAWQTEFRRAGRSTDVNMDNWVRMRMLGSLDTSIFAHYPAREIECDLRNRCAAWIAPYREEVNTRQLDLLYAYKMMGHFGAYTGAASSVLRNELPFYLRPVFLTAFSTSHRHRNGHRLMRRMIEELQPRAAAVRTTSGGPAQPIRLGNVHRFLPYYVRLAAKAAEKVSGVRMRVYRPREVRRPPMPSELRLAALRKVVDGDPRSLRSGVLFNTAELDRLLAAAARPDFAHAQILGRIVTVEAALRAVDTGVASADLP